MKCRLKIEYVLSKHHHREIHFYAKHASSPIIKLDQHHQEARSCWPASVNQSAYRRSISALHY